MADEDSPDRGEVYRKALGLLVRREHSRHELMRKLEAKGADATVAEAALDTLSARGYQDDARFAEMLVRTRLGSGFGPLYIRAALQQHGIAAETVAVVLDNTEADWTALAREALRRRYGGRPPKDRAESIKRGHFLQRRGFDAASIHAALRTSDGD